MSEVRERQGSCENALWPPQLRFQAVEVRLEFGSKSMKCSLPHLYNRLSILRDLGIGDDVQLHVPVVHDAFES